MDTEDTGSTGRARRRRVFSAGSGGFSSSGLSDSSQGGSVRDLNAEVEDTAVARATTEPTTLSEADAIAGAAINEEFSPRNRLAAVGRRSSDYEREYRLQLLHRMLMRSVPLDEIAKELDISVSQVQYDRKELHKRLREESRKLDVELLVGDNMGFYNEVSAMALRASSQSKLPMATRLAAMRTSLAARNDGHRFMQAAGVFDVLRFKLSAAGDGKTDIQRMMEMAGALLDGDTDLQGVPDDMDLSYSNEGYD